MVAFMKKYEKISHKTEIKSLLSVVLEKKTKGYNSDIWNVVLEIFIFDKLKTEKGCNEKPELLIIQDRMYNPWLYIPTFI